MLSRREPTSLSEGEVRPLPGNDFIKYIESPLPPTSSVSTGIRGQCSYDSGKHQMSMPPPAPVSRVSFAIIMMVVEIDHAVRGGGSELRAKGMISPSRL